MLALLSLCRQRYKPIHQISLKTKNEEVDNMLRASVAAGVKIMSFYHIKCLFYYFTTLFYNISFIRCFIIQFYTLK